MALQRLAAFFQEQYYHQSGKRKPVILVGPKADSGRCLVIGFEATNRMQVREGRAGGTPELGQLGGGLGFARPATLSVLVAGSQLGARQEAS